jgi:DNA-binding NarL/FixJ family response regulator
VQPDVAVLDLHMPGINGVEVTRRIIGTSPHIGVLVLTMFDDDDSVFAAMRAGARGYLPKDADSEDLVRAIRAVAGGDVIFGESIATRLQSFFKADRGRPATDPFPELTDREDEVLELIARGQSNAEIARQLQITDKTVRNHVANVFNKLHVADRSQAIVRAREAGLGRDTTTG